MPGEKGRVLTGARARFILGGKKVGFATNVAGSEEITLDPLELLDNIEVDEFVPTAYRVTLTASLVRIVKETIKSQGFFPKTGNSPQEHLTNILLQKALSGIIEDSKTGAKVMTGEQIFMTSRNFTINARGVVGKDVTFSIVRMKDESEA